MITKQFILAILSFILLIILLIFMPSFIIEDIGCTSYNENNILVVLFYRIIFGGLIGAIIYFTFSHEGNNNEPKK